MQPTAADTRQKAQLDKKIFWPALAIVAAIGVPLMVAPEAGTKAMSTVLSFLTGKFGWLYLWFGVLVFGLLVWLAASRFGKVLFGQRGDTPQFSTVTWIAMIFTAGIGGGIMYWGMIEWAYYYTDPPFGVEPRSTAAAEWAATYPMYHWGFIGWALYCLPALPLAYAYHVRKRPTLRLSDACRGIIGDRADGWLGRTIDVLFIFGVVGAAGTSLGLEVPIVSEGVAALSPLSPGTGLDIGILVAWTLLFGVSVYLGLQRGLRRLAQLNLWLAGALAVFLLIAGPTVFIVDTFTNSVGTMMQNFVQMSFYMDPIGGSGFEESWTVFYWAWWIAYAPFLGLFTAKISRGRTMRGVIVAMLVAGSFGNWIAFALMSNTGLSFQLNGTVPVAGILENEGPTAAIVATLQALPLGWVVLAVFILLLVIFLATTLDSSAYTMAAVASRELPAEVEPARWHRVVWAVALAGVSIALMYAGGLEALQTLAIITAFPLIFVLVIVVLSFRRWLLDDYPAAKPVSVAVTAETRDEAPIG
ncbi:MAG: BCCT family transporter [Actinophytocola sp.]|nr:BCCT family transporter [Actinophytocola sp.]